MNNLCILKLLRCCLIVYEHLVHIQIIEMLYKHRLLLWSFAMVVAVSPISLFDSASYTRTCLHHSILTKAIHSYGITHITTGGTYQFSIQFIKYIRYNCIGI
jgi:hypothetical protein